MSSLAILGANVSTFRKAQEMTQEELAKKSDLSLSYVIGIENGVGDISLEQIDTLAKSLGKTSKELLTEQQDESIVDDLKVLAKKFEKLALHLQLENSKLDVDLTLIQSITNVTGVSLVVAQSVDYESIQNSKLEVRWLKEVREAMKLAEDIAQEITSTGQRLRNRRTEIEEKGKILREILSLLPQK